MMRGVGTTMSIQGRWMHCVCQDKGGEYIEFVIIEEVAAFSLL